MNNIEVKKISDIYKIKDSIVKYDKITIFTSKIKYQGVLRFAFKYAFWSLKKGGIINVIDKQNIGYGFKLNEIKFWQVRSEFFKSVFDHVEVLENNLNKGIISVRKKYENPILKGITFGYVFSGLEIEFAMLENSFKIINEFSNVEIIICGPSGYEKHELFLYYNVIYIQLDLNEENRVLYTKKKNEIFNKGNYDVVIIAHSRILITKSFIERLKDTYFEVLCPQVYWVEKNKKFRYIDYLLISSYNIVEKPKFNTVGLKNIDKNYLYKLKGKVPYIDGGVVIFNKKIIKYEPFSNYLGWGEAEDVEMSEFLNQRGYLLDINFDLVCYTQTNKLDYNSKKINRIYNKIIKYFKFCKLN